MLPEPPLIEIRNATIWRGRTRVFDRLDLTIEQHERVAILGPNGAGKTTLLKLVNREIYPASGTGATVRILGRDDWNVWDLRRQIGIVSHELQSRYTPSTTALDVVVSGFHSSIGVHGTLAGLVTDAEREAALQALASLGAADLATTPLGRMSAGQQRRCLLARALVHDPATLILDEPTAGLDFAASFEFLARIRQLARLGRNLLVVSHHLGDIPPEIERVVLLAEGGIVADGPKAGVLTGARLSAAYGVPIRVLEADGHFLAIPG